MTTDNRTNEQLAERLRQFAESQAMDFDSPNVAMTLNEVADRLSGTVTEAQVEVAAIAMHRDTGPRGGYGWTEYLPQARAALVAAQGVAPQAPNAGESTAGLRSRGDIEGNPAVQLSSKVQDSPEIENLGGEISTPAQPSRTVKGARHE